MEVIFITSYKVVLRDGDNDDDDDDFYFQLNATNSLGEQKE